MTHKEVRAIVSVMRESEIMKWGQCCDECKYAWHHFNPIGGSDQGGFCYMFKHQHKNCRQFSPHIDFPDTPEKVVAFEIENAELITAVEPIDPQRLLARIHKAEIIRKLGELQDGCIHLLCSACGKTIANITRQPNDPEQAALLTALCDDCDHGGGFDQSEYFNKDGKELNPS